MPKEFVLEKCKVNSPNNEKNPHWCQKYRNKRNISDLFLHYK